MRKLLLTVVALSVLATATGSTAQAYLQAKPKDRSNKAILASQTVNLKHARYVCNNGANAHKRWACHAVKWLTRERNETLAKMVPKWGPWSFPDSCLREISRRETAGTYSPTIWNYQGSGAYGIGQALPASKMARYGSDYMTNPWTQLRWMIDYVNGRYGSSCAALAYHNAHGYY